MAGTDHSETVPEFHRQHIEDEIERLIGLLDFIDPDSELEPNGDDEPSLGSLGSSSTAGQFHWGLNCGGGEDLELDEADDEPSLGSLSCLPAHFGGFGTTSANGASPWSQVRWAHGGINDAEEQCDDEGCPDPDLEDNGDGEPSLGSLGSGDIDMPQTYWALGNRRDLEDACEDEGADIDHGDANGCCGATRNYDGPCSPVIGGAQPA